MTKTLNHTYNKIFFNKLVSPFSRVGPSCCGPGRSSVPAVFEADHQFVPANGGFVFIWTLGPVIMG